MFCKQNPIVKLIVEAPNEQWEYLGFYMHLKGEDGVAVTINCHGSAYPFNSTLQAIELVKYNSKIKAKYKALQLYFVQKALGHEPTAN